MIFHFTDFWQKNLKLTKEAGRTRSEEKVWPFISVIFQPGKGRQLLSPKMKEHVDDSAAAAALRNRDADENAT
jgi:hypothetical protein